MQYTKETFIEAIKGIDADNDFIKFCESCKDYQEIVKKAPTKYKIWALKKEFEEFEDYCDWRELSGNDWISLLSKQPRYAEYTDWDKLVGID